jgi:hypothetical protein
MQRIDDPPTATEGRALAARPRVTYVLWAVQGLLALLFLFTGGMKLALPMEALAQSMPLPLPEAFVRFLGLAELAGAIGLVLPGLLHIRPGLTPLAAAGLAIIMIGATGYTLLAGQGAAALLPVVAGLLAAFVAYGRWRLAPSAPRRRQMERSTA